MSEPTRCVRTTDDAEAAQERLRGLVTANRSIVKELSLAAVLERIVEAARDVAHARYAALGVIAADGSLEQFVHVGMANDIVVRIGELPRGRGVLGAVIENPEPIRLARIGRDPRSSGFPAGHPPMTTFLGVPVRSRDTVFGNLYLTDRLDGEDFSNEDEELILALAATAGIAIENAKLYEESRRQQEWLRASEQISQELLTTTGDHRLVLHHIALSMQRLADADLVAVIVPTEDDRDVLEVIMAAGLGSTGLLGHRYPRRGSLAAQTMDAGAGQLGLGVMPPTDAPKKQVGVKKPVGVENPVGLENPLGVEDPLGVDGPRLTLPIVGDGHAHGVIALSRTSDRPPFTTYDLAQAGTFAAQASLAMNLAYARVDQQRLARLEDRDRIANDLHDHVIQRLFATGLSIQSVATGLSIQSVATGLRQEPLGDRLGRAVIDIDDTIRQIRTTIFGLRDDVTTDSSVRAAVLAVVEQAPRTLPSRPLLIFDGPIDTVVDASTVNDIEAVVREALANVARHASSRAVSVKLDATDGNLSIVVSDDGLGLPPDATHRGLANLAQRARRHGGQMTLTPSTEGGLELRWTIPLQP